MVSGVQEHFSGEHDYSSDARREWLGSGGRLAEFKTVSPEGVEFTGYFALTPVRTESLIPSQPTPSNGMEAKPAQRILSRKSKMALARWGLILATPMVAASAASFTLQSPADTVHGIESSAGKITGVAEAIVHGLEAVSKVGNHIP